MALYTSGDSVNAIVADIGAWSTKIGYAGEDYPRSYFRSVRALRGERVKMCLFVAQTSHTLLTHVPFLLLLISINP